MITLTTPKQVDQVVRHQRDAKVEVLHHDLRSVPQPMTADALAASGSSTPAKHHGGARTPHAGNRPHQQGGGRGGYQGNRGQRPGSLSRDPSPAVLW